MRALEDGAEQSRLQAAWESPKWSGEQTGSQLWEGTEFP